MQGDQDKPPDKDNFCPTFLCRVILEGVQKSGDKNNSQGCSGHRIKYSRLRVVNTLFDSSKFRWKYPAM